MFGIEDFWIWSAYLLSLLSTVACAVYGVVFWNKDGEGTTPTEDAAWEREEQRVEETL